MLFKLPLVVGLIFLLTQTNDPLLCAGIWAAATLFMSVMFSVSFTIFALLWAAAAFLLALGYFALLDHLDTKGWWWVVMPFGAVVLIVFP